jgi:ketosteroid isomerase-like protein
VSEHNVELLRRVAEAFNRHDIEALIAYCDPSIEFHSVLAGQVTGTVYYGHAGLRSWHRDLTEAWGDEIRLELEAYLDRGDHTLIATVVHGRGQYSGAEVAMAMALVARWRSDLVIHLTAYTPTEDALRDLGVTEDELEPIEP